MELRLPVNDTPAWTTLGLLAALCFAIGVGLAYGGTGEPTEAEGPTRDTSSGAAERPESSPETSADAGTAGADAEPPAPGSENSDAGSPESASLDAGGNTDAGGAEVRVESPVEDGAQTSETLDTPSVGPATRFVHGRVAYLRCEGTGRGGRCPRDEPLEAAVWEVLGGLADCAVPGPGQGDLRIAWEGAAPADVLWRDTFADDVVRLDRDAVIACVQTGLTSTRPSQPGGRLLISFRFSME